MALDKLVDSTQLDTDLAAVASAIRTKGGTSAELEFPSGFVSAVQAIPTGITPSGTKQISITENGTTTEDVTNFASAEITVDVQGGGGPTVDDFLNGDWPSGNISIASTTIRSNAFYGNEKILSVDAPNATVIEAYAFANCINCERIHVPALRDIYNSWGSTNVEILCFPSAYRSRSAAQNFSVGKSSLKTVDIGPNFIDNLRGRDFKDNSGLTTVILRPNRLIAVSALNTFDGTPFTSNGTGGTLYVPQALIADYQAATNWSTILSYANNQIQPIEGSVYETQYADGTPIVQGGTT